VLAAVGTTMMTGSTILALAVLVAAFLLIGLGVGAAGTSLLVLLAERSAPHRRAAAASIAWILMIAGFVVTTAVAGSFLDPYSPERLVAVAAVVSLAAFVLAGLAVWGVERGTAPASSLAPKAPMPPFREALAEVWAEPEARRFAIFVFVSMLAYSAQDLILEPFAGSVFGLTLGETTKLTSVQNSGVLIGMVLVAVLGSRLGRTRDPLGVLRVLTVAGCVAAAVAMVALAVGGFLREVWPLRLSYAAIGFANGVFAAAAIASMMQLVGKGASRREGVRMGMFGAAQAIAFGLGGIAGTVATDLAHLVLGQPVAAYGFVFLLDALLFAWAAWLALSIGSARLTRPSPFPSALPADFPPRATAPFPPRATAR